MMLAYTKTSPSDDAQPELVKIAALVGWGSLQPFAATARDFHAEGPLLHLLI